MKYGLIIWIGCYANDNDDLRFKAKYLGENSEGKLLIQRVSPSEYCKKNEYDFHISDCVEIK